jgi:Ca2+-binding EF-hand superfamily protein
MNTLKRWASILLLCGTGAAVAQEPAPNDAKPVTPPADLFVSIDFNRDARVDREELRNFMARLFTTDDDNGDGTLTPKEMTDPIGADGKPIKHQKVKVEDMIGASDIAFDKLDKDKDGFLSRTEMNIPAAAAKENTP